MTKRPKHLIIPDAHAHPSYSNKRFSALGKLIVDERPDVVVCIGDFADMTSLSNFDRGKLSYEGRKYQRDIGAAIDAQERLGSEVAKAHNYHPRWEMFLGNHENRIVREVNEHPQLEGKLSIDDLGYNEFGWNVHPFLEVGQIDGIAYSHYFVSGVAGRPISGESIGKTLCNKLHTSAIQGHSHVYDHSERTRADGQKIFGLSCGSFCHEEYIEEWNRATVRMWWAGIVILEDLDKSGYYDSLRTLTRRKLLRDFL